MNPELMTIFQNIIALVEQAKQMSNGEQGKPEGDEVTPDIAASIVKYLKQMEGGAEEKPEEEKSEEVKKAEAEKLEKPDAGTTTASDDAETIVDGKGDVNDKTLKEVAKQLAQFIFQKSVHKSADSNSVDVVHKALTQIVDEQKELRKAIENILGGLGIADGLIDVNKVEKSQELKKPGNDETEIKKSLNYIKEQLGLRETKPEVKQTETVHKSIAGALSSLVNQ